MPPTAIKRPHLSLPGSVRSMAALLLHFSWNGWESQSRDPSLLAPRQFELKMLAKTRGKHRKVEIHREKYRLHGVRQVIPFIFLSL